MCAAGQLSFLEQVLVVGEGDEVNGQGVHTASF
jgi:hypothetical protein